MKKILFLFSLLLVMCITFDAGASVVKPPGDNFGTEMVVLKPVAVNQAIEIILPFDYSFNRFIVANKQEQSVTMNKNKGTVPKYVYLTSNQFEKNVLLNGISNKIIITSIIPNQIINNGLSCGGIGL